VRFDPSEDTPEDFTARLFVGSASWNNNKGRIGILERGGRCRLFVQRDFQFIGEFLRAERAAGEIAAADFQCWYFSLAMVGEDYDFFAGFIFFNVHFLKCESALFQKRLDSPAVRAPASAVHRNFFHSALHGLDELENAGIIRQFTATPLLGYRHAFVLRAIWMRINARCR
jgi:hypothetical protein